MQMGCIVTTISEVWVIVSPWGVFSSPCRNSIVCHYSTSILRMNTVMHINVALKWVFFTMTHYLERTPVCFWSPSQGSRFPETPPPARHLCKVGLAPQFDSGEIHSQNHHLFGEQTFFLKPISLSCVVWCLSRMFFLNSTTDLFVELIAFTQCQRRSAWLHFCSVCCLFVWGPECFPDILMSNPSYR